MQTRLPVATLLWLPGKEERCSETLDAMYQYGNLRQDVELGDTHFRIDAKTAEKRAKTGEGVVEEERGEEKDAAPSAVTAQPEE
jgi:hypothetical protein